MTPERRAQINRHLHTAVMERCGGYANKVDSFDAGNLPCDTCGRLGWHNWSKWALIQIAQLKAGKFENVCDRQERTCKDCGRVQRQDFY